MVFVFDLAGCLTNNTARVPLLQAGRWKEYFVRLPDDPPREDVIKLWHSLEKYTRIIWSGEPEEHRDITVDWLQKYDLRADSLLLRPEWERRPNAILKTAMLVSIPSDSLFVDDDETTVDRLRKKNMDVLWLPQDSDRVVLHGECDNLELINHFGDRLRKDGAAGGNLNIYGDNRVRYRWRDKQAQAISERKWKKLKN